MNKHSNNIFFSDGKLLTQEAKLNVVSCFDGMSCLRIALDELGIPVNKYFASEVDKYAMTVANALFEDTIQVGNIEFVTKEMINHKIDLLAGGSPCQGFSFAGKQLNFEDPRSKLFFEFVRLKNELKPKYFFLENVKMKKEHQDVISKYMGCEPIIVNSALVSAQNRVRNYWTNIPNIKQPDDEFLTTEIVLGIKNPIGQMQPYPRNYKELGLKRIERFEARTDGKSNCCLARSDKNLYETKYGIEKLTPYQYGLLQTIPKYYLDKILDCDVSNSQLYKMFGNGWTIKVVTHFLKGMSEKKEGKKKILLRANTPEPSSLAQA